MMDNFINIIKKWEDFYHFYADLRYALGSGKYSADFGVVSYRL
jgi:hypothetical protein